MKTYEVYLTAQAEENYKNICAYLETVLGNKTAKKNFVKAFDEKMETLGKSPAIFQVCEYTPFALQNIRYALVKQYKIFYTIDDQSVNVLFIKHCLQDEHNLQS